MGSLETVNQKTSGRRRLWGSLAVVALTGSLLAVGTPQSGAAVKTRSLNATCVGADQPTTDALSAFGGSLTVPVSAEVNAPDFVEPGQTGVKFTATMSISLDTKTVNAVAAISPQLIVSGVNAPIAVTGPTSTKSINATVPSQTLTVTAGKPFQAKFPAFTGVLNDIGNSGLIKVTSSSLNFSIKLTKGPLKNPLNVRCSTGATLASIPVRVAGSPNIEQPINVATVEGESVTVDVLGEHVTNGKTKDGVEQQVDPSSLKVLDGDAQVVDGKIVSTGPAAGTASEVTFEVCAGTIKIAEADPGTSEVQEIRLYRDTANNALKREIGSRFAFGTEVGDKVVWSIDFNALFREPTSPKTEELAEGQQSWWQRHLGENALAYLLMPHSWPTAEEMQAGLESIPSIGAGNVKVTRGEIVTSQNVPEGVELKFPMTYRPYKVEFTGALANKALDQVTVSKMYSILPSEIKDQLLVLAGGAGGDDGGEGGGEDTTTPIPDGLTAQEYIDQLLAQAGRYGTAGDIINWIATMQLAMTVIGENILDLIDPAAMTALLNELFQPTPAVVTVTQGEDPTPEEVQKLCSQGIVTLNSAAANDDTATTPPGAATDPTVGGASLSAAG